MPDHDRYQLLTNPPDRLATTDIGAIGLHRHYMKALIELDVTAACQKFKQLPAAEQKITITAWLIKVISLVVTEHKAIHGLRQGEGKIVIFDHVDVAVMVEREINDNLVPLPSLIRSCDQKSLIQINDELSAAKNESAEGHDDHNTGGAFYRLAKRLYRFLPFPLRRFYWRQVLKNPFWIKKNMGTVMVTSVGMIGKIRGWFIPLTIHPLCFTIGSIIEKPAVIKGKIEARRFLHLTVLVDHDVVDGAPAVRALNYLKELVESAAEL